jgi:cytochrome c oxidase subunit 2
VIRSTPNRLGTFEVRCSQLCGLYHAFMDAPGSVVTTKQFDQWLVSQGASRTQAASTAQSS